MRPLLKSLHELPKPFRWHLAVLLLVYTADSIMSYMAPVVITRQVENTIITGVILACSSLAGMIVDFVFAKTFVGKKHQFFLKILLSLTLFFPFSLLVWQVVPSLLFAMVVWGIYFEAMVFSNHRAVQDYLPLELHVKGWGIITFIRTISLVVGPFLASYFVDQSIRLPLIIAFSLYLFAIVVFAVSKRLAGWYTSITPRLEPVARSFAEEMAVWRTFAKTLWPLLGLVLLYYLIESAFFSIGPLYAESLKVQNHWASLFVSLYCLPGIIMGGLAARMAKPFGKKFVAYLGGITGGGGLVMMSYQEQISSILLWTFLGSIGLGMIFPQLMAVFEDYVARVRQLGNDLIGLTAIFGSLAYVVGPIANGSLYQLWHGPLTFRFWGAALLVYSIVLLLIVPRRVKMPQQALAEVLGEQKA